VDARLLQEAVMPSPAVSICINNYNYAQFVGRAIESALAQRDVSGLEVIVVDDGSTDGSAEVIAGFEARTTFVRRENGGHAAAMNSGFAASSGDLVIFLDADDELDPTCAARALAAAGPGVAKVHWRLRLVDADGRPFGVNPSMQTPLAEGDVSSELARTGWYSTVPTSGNAFPRRVLEQLMPLPEAEFTRSGEALLIMGAAFLGPIAAIDEPLTSYRVHGDNAFAVRGSISDAAMQRRLDHARVLDRWLPQLAARHGISVPEGRVLGQPDFRLMELVERRRDPTSGTLSRVGAGVALLRAASRTAALRPRRRAMLGVAGLLVPVLPRPLVDHICDVALAGKPMRPLPRRGG
jgi:hypothetical protein